MSEDNAGRDMDETVPVEASGAASKPFLRNSSPEQASFLWGLALLHAISRAHGHPMTWEGHLHVEMEAAHALLDLRNLLRAVDWGLSGVSPDHPVHADHAAFNARFPGIVAARDALEHFDEYATGRGRLQRRAGERDGWHFYAERDTPDHVVAHVGPYSIDLTELGEAVSNFVALMGAGTTKEPAPGNVYAAWYAANGYELVPRVVS